MSPLRALVVFGTRPEAIKMAPVVLGLRDDPRFEPTVLVTAQHRELLDQVLDVFGIVPDHDLDLMQRGQSLTSITTRALDGISALLDREPFDAVIVHGDTTTTFAAALAAFYHHIPIAHIEAGMRTHDLSRPFPEEANRALVGRLARWNFVPSEACECNLLDEAVPADRVIRTEHNTAIDAIRIVEQMPYEFQPGPIAEALSSGDRILLVTAHRRESWGTPMEGIFQAIANTAERFDDVRVLVATHPNPIVADAAARILGDRERITLIGAQEYLPFVKLMSSAHLIVSDSGGIQEEGPALGTPVLVLRDVTEYPELLTKGAVALAGTPRDSVERELARVLSNPAEYQAMKDACATRDARSSVSTILDVIAHG